MNETVQVRGEVAREKEEDEGPFEKMVTHARGNKLVTRYQRVTTTTQQQVKEEVWCGFCSNLMPVKTVI